MLKFKTLQGRFTVFMLLPVGVLLISAGVFGFLYTRSSLLHQWEKTAVLELQQEAHRIDMQLNRPKQVINMYLEASADHMGGHHTREWLLEQLRDLPGVIRLNFASMESHAPPLQPPPMMMGRQQPDDGDTKYSMQRHRRNAARITPPRYDSAGKFETVSLITDVEADSGLGSMRLEVVIRLDGIFANIDIPGLWKGHHAFLLDDDGRVIYERNGGSLDKLFYELGSLESRTFDTMVNMNYGTLLGDGHPPKQVAGFYRLMEAPWTLVMIAPGDQILQPIQRFGFYYLVYGTFFILFVLLLIRWTSVQTVDGISRLSRAARQVVMGEYEGNLQVKTEDEVGELTHSFNSMISHLKERMRLERVINLAKEVQQNLLPQNPLKVKDFEIVGRSVYCDATGGDYFDYFQFPQMEKNSVAVVVGDVAGHGVAAALFMTTARALLRSRITQPGSLAEVISDVNRHLCLDTESSGNFMTLFFMLIDSENSVIRWVRAGHDPALRYDPHLDRFGEIRGDGIALGVSQQMTFEENRLEDFSQGEIIVLGTDGLWETENAAGERFGKERLRQVIRENRAKSPQVLADRIIERVKNFHGAAVPRDDITLVVIRKSAAR